MLLNTCAPRHPQLFPWRFPVSGQAKIKFHIWSILCSQLPQGIFSYPRHPKLFPGDISLSNIVISGFSCVASFCSVPYRISPSQQDMSVNTQARYRFGTAPLPPVHAWAELLSRRKDSPVRCAPTPRGCWFARKPETAGSPLPGDLPPTVSGFPKDRRVDRCSRFTWLPIDRFPTETSRLSIRFCQIGHLNLTLQPLFSPLQA